MGGVMLQINVVAEFISAWRDGASVRGVKESLPSRFPVPMGLPRFARNDNKSEVLAVTGGCSGGVHLRLARCGLRLRREGIPSFTIHSAEAISAGTAGRDEARPYK